MDTKSDDMSGMPPPNGISFIATLGLLAATSAIAMDIVLPATPIITRAFSVGPEDAQLVITAYIFGLAMGLIPIGLFADRFGRRPVSIACILVFILVGSLTFAPLSFEMLLVLRFVQGVCGGVGPSLSRAIIRDLDHPVSSAQIMAVVTAILSMAPMFAPLLGSFLATTWGWRAPFWSSAIYGLITLAAVLAWLPETRRHKPTASVIGHFSATVRLIWKSPRSKTGIALFTLPFVGYAAILTSLSTVVHDMYAVSPEQFGLYFAFCAGTYFIGSMLTRRLLSSVNPEQILALGVGILAFAGALSAALTISENPPAFLLWLAASIHILGLAVCLPITTLEALAPLAQSAASGASLLAACQIGLGAFGSFVSAQLYDHTQSSMCLVLAASALVTGLLYILHRQSLFGPLERP